MVLKSKGGEKSRSVKSSRNKKSDIKYHRKNNYKKKKSIPVTEEECVICYQNVDFTQDNTIHCGKKSHILCSSCKMKMKDSRCPMCRSHNIPIPKQSHELLPIFSKGTRFGMNLTFQDCIDVFSNKELSRPRHLTK
jgi:hypothetical protein